MKRVAFILCLGTKHVPHSPKGEIFFLNLVDCQKKLIKIWIFSYYSRNLDIPPFLWSACRVHLMSSLPGWACQYYSPNLAIPTFPWSACRVHLMLSLLGWACQYYSPNLTFPHFCGQPVGYIQGRQRGGCPNLKFYNDVFVGDTEKDICNILY